MPQALRYQRLKRISLRIALLHSHHHLQKMKISDYASFTLFPSGNLIRGSRSYQRRLYRVVSFILPTTSKNKVA
jgi:hypothetical protein